MQNNQFVIRTPIGTVVLHLLLGLGLLAFGVLRILYADLDLDDDILVGAIALTVGIGFTCRGVVLSFWKCIVEGNHISVRSLFRRKEITFFDIKGVAPMGQASQHRAARSGVNHSFIGIDLYSDTGKLFHIHGSKDGFQAFITRLEERNIPGVEDLPKGIRWK